MANDNFEPKIVGFLFCNWCSYRAADLAGSAASWCSYRAADLAGSARIKYPENVRIIRVMCSGRVDPTFVFKALALGDAVMVAGCHPGECHYIEQNYKAMRRFHMVKHTLRAMGLEEDRVRLVWASAAEGQRLAEHITRLVDDVKGLGPLHGRPIGRKTASGKTPWKISSKNTKRRWRCRHEQPTKENWRSTGRPPAAAARSRSSPSTRRFSTWPRPSTS